MMGLGKKIAASTLLVVFVCSVAFNFVMFRQNRLTKERVEVIQKYLTFLGEGKYQELLQFFLPNAPLSDPIKGLTTPEIYYPGLHDYLVDPKVTVYDIYLGIQDKDVLAAHFTMKVRGKDGNIENRGQIVDLFVFAPDSTKIAKLYIQNNMTDYEFAH